MTFVSVPWDGSENDMYEHEWRRYHELWGDGLISVGSREVSQNDREFSISGMEGVIQGAYFRQVGTDSVMVPPPSSGQRISQVSLKYDPGTNSVSLSVRHGGGGSNPIPPTPVQEPNGVWEMPIFEFGPAGSGDLESLPRVDLRRRSARVSYVANVRQLEILGLSARHGDLAIEDGWRWWQWDRDGGRWWSRSRASDTGEWVEASTTTSWLGSYYYAVQGGVAFVRGRVRRFATTWNPTVIFDLPRSVLRPAHGVDTHVWQNLSAGRRFHAMSIEPSGRATIYAGADGPIVGEVACRFECSWPIFPSPVSPGGSGGGGIGFL